MDEHTRLRVGGAEHGSGALFSVKLQPPRLGEGSLRRPRLLATIDRDVEAGTVIVRAPAGSGKSTLLTDWARGRQRPVGWLTLGTAEREPARFAEYALSALQGAVADTGSRVRLPRLPASRRVDEHFLTEVSEHLASLPAEVVLVLDDFQHVIGSATERLIRRIVRHPFEQARLVVLTRREPSLGQTNLRLRGVLRELGPADLAFDSDETAQLARLRGVERRDPAELAALHQVTLGWPTGLEAVLDSWRDQPGSDLPDAVRGARPVIADYLDTEVFGDRPREVEDFVARLTVVDEVCGELADALTGGRGAAGTLADLHRDRMFLEPNRPRSDERCTWYRWNPLVADVLRSRLKERAPTVAAELHRTAAEWFRDHGVPLDAVHHALAAGDVEIASEVLVGSWFSLAVAGETGSVRSLLRLFDEHLLTTDPELLLTSAFLALHDRDLSRACVLAQTAQDTAVGLPDARRFAVDVAGAAVRLRCAGLLGQPDTPDLYPATLLLLERMGRDQRPVTHAQRRRRALLLYALGTFELSRWLHAEAADHLTSALSEAAGLGLDDLLPRVRAQLVTCEIYAGRLELARTSALDVVEAAHRGQRPGSQGHAATHLAVAVVDLQRGDAATALESLELARIALHPVDRVTDARVRLVRHSALLLAGRTREAQDELDGLHDAAATWDAPAWVTLMTAIADAEQLRSTHRLDQALKALESAASLATDGLVRAVWCTAYAEALLESGRPAEARTLLAGLLAPATGDRPLEVLALVLDALAAARLELHDESAGSLSKAVRLSRRERILRPFLARSAHLRPLLESMLDDDTGYAADVVELLEQLPPADEPADVSTPVEPLTGRELEVLRALRTGATNEHIAARMFVSVNTLRSHIKQINRKLGTSSRREAVARARRLGLV